MQVAGQLCTCPQLEERSGTRRPRSCSSSTINAPRGQGKAHGARKTRAADKNAPRGSACARACAHMRSSCAVAVAPPRLLPAAAAAKPTVPSPAPKPPRTHAPAALYCGRWSFSRAPANGAPPPSCASTLATANGAVPAAASASEMATARAPTRPPASVVPTGAARARQLTGRTPRAQTTPPPRLRR